MKSELLYTCETRLLRPLGTSPVGWNFVHRCVSALFHALAEECDRHTRGRAPQLHLDRVEQFQSGERFARVFNNTFKDLTWAFAKKSTWREALWEDFGDFLTKDAFSQILDAYTEDNETLVIDTCPEHTVDPLEMIHWWKAEDPGEFHMGSKEYWESAMQDTAIPPKEGKESGADLLTVKDFMPQPWSQLI